MTYGCLLQLLIPFFVNILEPGIYKICGGGGYIEDYKAYYYGVIYSVF
jgi:hypothetical protein